MTAAVVANFQAGWTGGLDGISESAQQIRHSYESSDDRAESARAFEQSDFQKDLIRLYSECGAPNWDGYGASSLSINAILRAAQLAWLVSPEDLPTGIAPEVDGEVALEWIGHDETWLSLSFGDTPRVTYAGVLGEGRKIHGEDLLDDGLPDHLFKAIEQISRKKISR